MDTSGHGTQSWDSTLTVIGGEEYRRQHREMRERIAAEVMGRMFGEREALIDEAIRRVPEIMQNVALENNPAHVLSAMSWWWPSWAVIANTYQDKIRAEFRRLVSGA